VSLSPHRPPPKKVAKVHNAPAATAAKIELRRKVLEHLTPAHVFDCYCGPEGVMWAGAWKDAAGYVGCDLEWHQDDPRRRYVGDTLRVLRNVDLAPWNVFDVDAFGSPWEVLTILAARRTWAPGERGAVVITDGSGKRLNFGAAPKALCALVGLSNFERLVPLETSGDTLRRIALQAWLARCRLKVLHAWVAESRGTREQLGGGYPMDFKALVFEGLAPGEAPAPVEVPDGAP
jgi:hypothetical protein